MDSPGRGPIEYQKQITVDGKDYKFLVLPPSRAFKLAAKLAKVLGEPVAALASSGGDESKVNEALPLAVRSLMRNLDEDQVLSLFKELVGSVSYENRNINFEDHFQGQLGHLMKLVTEIVKFQFSDFFVAIGQAVANAGKNL